MMTRNKIMLAAASSLLALGLVAGPMTASAQKAPLIPPTTKMENNVKDGPQGNAGGIDTPEGPNDKVDAPDQPEGPNDKADRDDREDNGGGRDTDNVQEGPGNQNEEGHEDND